MEKLIWVYDSPYSRCIKWLLLKQRTEHQDYILSWKEMASDKLLSKFNPKKQVPTLIRETAARTDSLLIGLDYLPNDWHQTLDAKMFRLADSEVEAAIIFLFRANLLQDKFGESDNSRLMRDAGLNTFKVSVDNLIDQLLSKEDFSQANFGAVLLLSTLLAAISLSGGELASYRHHELLKFAAIIETDKHYLQMISDYQGNENNSVPFEFPR